MKKEELVKFLESEIFSNKNSNYPESHALLTSIKDLIVVNLDKEGVDLVDLVHWTVSYVFLQSLKALLSEISDRGPSPDDSQNGLVS